MISNVADARRVANELFATIRADDAKARAFVHRWHPDAAHFGTDFRFFAPADAQLAIARQHGHRDWLALLASASGTQAVDTEIPRHERIDEIEFRRAVDFLDAGDVQRLGSYLNAHPELSRHRIEFEADDYFKQPGLLEFVAENPIRHGHLPDNITAIAALIIDAGAPKDQLDATLGLVASGRIVRECGHQVALLELLCNRGADADGAVDAALAHGEFESANVLLGCGARRDLVVCAALGETQEFEKLLRSSGAQERQQALALAAQFGRVAVLRALCDSGEGVNRYNPDGFHGHATPLHSAVSNGHLDAAQVLVAAGAKLDAKDRIHGASPLEWARHLSHEALIGYLQSVATDESR